MKNTSNIHITQPLRLGLKLHSFAQPSSTIQPLSQIYATQQIPNKIRENNLFDERKSSTSLIKLKISPKIILIFTIKIHPLEI